VTAREKRAPEMFEVVDHLGNEVKLEERRGRWLLLVFHRHLA
tara:strand:+ start:346 stop:471 length:126 start_codon:yes stop_codon:yes gene_type:complete